VDISARPRLDGSGWELVGPGKLAKQIAHANNKRRDDERKAAAGNDPANCLANGGNGSPGSSASAAEPTNPATHTAAELQSIISLLQKGGDTATAAAYQEKLTALQTASNTPKTLSYAHAQRLAAAAEKRLDKAAEGVSTAQEGLRTAKEDLAVAAQQVREAEVVRDKLFATEAEANGQKLEVPKARTTTICVDKVALGGEIIIDFGSLAPAVAEAPPRRKSQTSANGRGTRQVTSGRFQPIPSTHFRTSGRIQKEAA